MPPRARYEVAEALEKASLTELHERRPDRELETNMEFWTAIVLGFAEVPAPTPSRAATPTARGNQARPTGEFS
jgi:citrate synthase